jgi:hypothetical protein
MLSPLLGSRIFWSARAWAAVFVWTFAYSDGAGFGGIVYQNDCNGGPLFYQSLFPPDVSISAFLGTAATIWVNGLYQSGITVAFFLVLIVMLVGSRLNESTAERVLSMPLITLVAVIAVPAAYAAAVHTTLATGNSPCAL